MLRYLKGEKTLAEAFGVSVGLVLLSAGVVLVLNGQEVFDDASTLLLATFLITVPVRLFAWTSVLRCSRNTDSGAFRAIAIMIVVADMLHKLVYWSAVVWSLSEQDKLAEHRGAQFEQCKTQIVKDYGEPMENLHGKARLDYGSGEPAYEVLTRSRTKTYRCVITEANVRLSEERYVKWYDHRENLDTTGTALLTEIELTPRYLALQFGEPGPGGDLRVSGIYTFISDADEVFTLYDYKSTTVWDADSGLPTPDEFWSSEEPVELSVGGKPDSDYAAFVEWLQGREKHWERLSQ